MSTKGKRKEHSNYGTKTGCTQSLPGVVLILLLQVYLGGIERLWLRKCVLYEKRVQRNTNEGEVMVDWLLDFGPQTVHMSSSGRS